MSACFDFPAASYDAWKLQSPPWYDTEEPDWEQEWRDEFYQDDDGIWPYGACPDIADLLARCGEDLSERGAE